MFEKDGLFKVALVLVILIAALGWDLGSLPIFSVPFVFAHCDTLDGPVIKEARKALETNNLNLVLKWVRKQDETEVKGAFEKTMAVRKLNSQARELADLYFFETLVRIHRAGEGEAYTGLEPAGVAIEPGIQAADKAVESGTAKEFTSDLGEQVAQRIRAEFDAVMVKKQRMNDSVEAGREYVAAYVKFIHFIERLHQLLGDADGHHADAKTHMEALHHGH
jgi:hypothetical protein